MGERVLEGAETERTHLCDCNIERNIKSNSEATGLKAHMKILIGIDKSKQIIIIKKPTKAIINTKENNKLRKT